MSISMPHFRYQAEKRNFSIWGFFGSKTESSKILDWAVAMHPAETLTTY